MSCLILALEYLHHNKILHKDIKPDNMVFDEKGYLFLTDMGLARLHLPNEKISDDSGTPSYMSPEIICCQPQDLNSDYYSLGVTLHELVFGKIPYRGANKKEIKEQIIKKEINLKIEDMPKGYSIECMDLINRLLKRTSDARIGKKRN